VATGKRGACNRTLKYIKVARQEDLLAPVCELAKLLASVCTPVYSLSLATQLKTSKEVING